MSCCLHSHDGPYITKLQHTINDKEKRCSKHGFEINVGKRAMMEFRQGGKVPTLAEIIMNRRKINNAKDYKYIDLKRTIGVSKSTRSRLIYLLAQ